MKTVETFLRILQKHTEEDVVIIIAFTQRVQFIDVLFACLCLGFDVVPLFVNDFETSTEGFFLGSFFGFFEEAVTVLDDAFEYRFFLEKFFVEELERRRFVLRYQARLV